MVGDAFISNLHFSFNALYGSKRNIDRNGTAPISGSNWSCYWGFHSKRGSLLPSYQVHPVKLDNFGL